MPKIAKRKDKVWTCAFDYGQLEACIIGMASRDAVFAKGSLEDYDIHFAWAQRALELCPQLVGLSSFGAVKETHIKTFRPRAKNEIVFPWIYDSHPKSTAKLLNMPQDLVDQLYNEFWSKYWQIKEWKDSVHTKYFKEGYVSTLMGSRRYGPLKHTERVNTIIQGTGGYINMGAMNRLSVLAYKLDRPQYQASINIHDDLTFPLPDITLERDIEFIAKEMCRKTHDFMWKIPLKVEVCLGDNWADLEEVAKFDTRDFNYEGEKAV